MPFGGAAEGYFRGADFGGEQAADGGAGGRFRREQVETPFPAPFLVVGDGVEDFLRRPGGVGVFDQGAGVGEDGGVVDFKLGHGTLF